MNPRQLALSFPEPTRRGGARAGAGRKPRAAHLRHTPHRARPVHRKANPVHVTLRAELRSLRTQRVALTVLGGLRDSNRDWFRVVNYSVQDSHVHLIVEAEDSKSLASGVRGLMVRVARRVNRVLRRRGRFWADRWHGSMCCKIIGSTREAYRSIRSRLPPRSTASRPRFHARLEAWGLPGRLRPGRGCSRAAGEDED